MAYVATVTLNPPTCERISKNYGIVQGIVDISTYNTTLVEITDITKHFKTILSVVAAIGDSGWMLEWIAVSGAFKAWEPANADVGDGPLQECSNADDISIAKFIAIGLI